MHARRPRNDRRVFARRSYGHFSGSSRFTSVNFAKIRNLNLYTQRTARDGTRAGASREKYYCYRIFYFLLPACKIFKHWIRAIHNSYQHDYDQSYVYDLRWLFVRTFLNLFQAVLDRYFQFFFYEIDQFSKFKVYIYSNNQAYRSL